MGKRFIGEIRPYSSPDISSRRFAGFIYDSTKRRADTGDMAHDFAFVDVTDVYSTRERAGDALVSRLAELNRNGLAEITEQGGGE